jgi:hypothetical protein
LRASATQLWTESTNRSDLPARGWHRPAMRNQKPTFYVCDGCDAVFFHAPEVCGEHQFCCEHCYDGWFRPKKPKGARLKR